MHALPHNSVLFIPFSVLDKSFLAVQASDRGTRYARFAFAL